MGAAACQGVCVSKKVSASTVRIVHAPTRLDLSSSMDDYDDHLDAQSDLLAPRVDPVNARIGVLF